MKAAVAKSHLYEKSLENPRIFPFDKATAYSMWKIALHKAKLNGKDKSTNRETIHPHTLRKLFRTRLGAAGIPVDVIEALMGHEKYLTEVYRKYSIDQLREVYLKGESALLVFTDAQEVTNLRKEIEERNHSMKTDYIGLSHKNLELEKKLNAMERENLETKKEMHQLSLTVRSLVKKLEKLTEG